MPANTEITFLVGKAETGNVEAQLSLADMYNNGYGLAIDMGLRTRGLQVRVLPGAPYQSKFY
jgi:hypothetical protein